MQHVWKQTIEGIPSFASCVNCGRVNNPVNIGKECVPGLSLDDINAYLNELWC